MTKRRTEKRKPGKWLYKLTRQAIYKRDNHTCYWCGKHKDDGIQLSLDHLVPWVYFGADKHTNLVTCCRKCNSKRGDKKLKQWYTVLENEYKLSSESISILKNRIKKVRRSSDSSIQRMRDELAGRLTMKLAPGHSLAK